MSGDKQLPGIELPVIPKKDLTPYIKVMRENPAMKLGVLKGEIVSLSSYHKGELVLFTPYTVEENYGNTSYQSIQELVKLCTIEVPAELYFKDKACNHTIKTMVGVPISLIEYEIIIDDTHFKASLREAVANYMASEGCSCCSDIDGHKEHTEALAKLLDVPAYTDGSGYDFSPFETKK